MNKRKESEQWLSLLETKFGTPEFFLKKITGSLYSEDLDTLFAPARGLTRVLARQGLLDELQVSSATKAYGLLWDLSLALFGRVRYPSEVQEPCWQTFTAVCTFFASPIPSRENMELIFELDHHLSFDEIEKMWSLAVKYATIPSYATAYTVLERILERASMEADIHEQESRPN